MAEVACQTVGWRFATVEDREVITAMVADAAEQASLRLTPPELATSPAKFRRPDGTSVFNGGETPPHSLAGDFGHQVPAPPRRTLLTDHLDYRPPHPSIRSNGTSPARNSNCRSPPVTVRAHTVASTPSCWLTRAFDVAVLEPDGRSRLPDCGVAFRHR
jgi:hypothetical protein